MGAFKQPHGGELKDLYLPEHLSDEVKKHAGDYPSWDLTPRQLCDLDLLLNGAFSPLEGFLGEADYEKVCDDMRLESRVLWPVPVTLDVSEAFAESVEAGSVIALRDPEGVLIATMDVSDLLDPGQTERGATCFRHHRRQSPGRRLSVPPGRPVYLGRQGARNRAAHLLRFQTVA